MFETAAQWVAPAATMIAAMMTAANLGPRVTGWGFVVFTVGAIAWVIVALASGQQNLLLSNAFLLIVDIVGIWRWLGRQARYEKGARIASEASADSAKATLFALSKLPGRSVEHEHGMAIGTAVDAMAACKDGRIAYIVVSAGGVGGVGERLHALAWNEVTLDHERIVTRLDADALERRPVLTPDCWPDSAEAIGGR